MWVEVLSEYLVVLIVAARLAAAPASADVEMMCDSAYVSGSITSQASGFPLAHGVMVTPSGRLPPWETSPVGSLCAGICVLLIDLQMTSFNMAWCWCLGVLLLFGKPWRPLASTRFPQTQLWGEQALIPSLSATDILTSSSVSLSPREAIEGVWINHQSEEPKLLWVWRGHIGYSWGHDCAEDWVHDRLFGCVAW